MCTRVRLPTQAIILHVALHRWLRARHGVAASAAIDAAPAPAPRAAALEATEEGATLATETAQNFRESSRIERDQRLGPVDQQ